MKIEFVLRNKQTNKSQAFKLTVKSTAHALKVINTARNNNKHIELVILLINGREV